MHRYVRYGSLLALGLCGGAARRALVVGLGGGTIVGLLRAARPRLRIDAVEIDPLVVRVARRYFGLEVLPAADRERLAIHTQDGAAYLGGLHLPAVGGGLWDIAFVDAYAAGVPVSKAAAPC